MEGGVDHLLIILAPLCYISQTVKLKYYRLCNNNNKIVIEYRLSFMKSPVKVYV